MCLVRKYLAALLLSAAFLLLSPKPASAVTVTISNTPATITDQPFTFDVSVSGAQSGINYLRVDLSRPAIASYFGFTWNGTSFYNGSDHTQYLPVTIDQSGNWSGAIQGKLDSTASEYTGPGQYNLRVRRYTPSGYNPTPSNTATVDITYQPSSTPSPTPTPTPTPTPQPVFTVTGAPQQINSDQSFETTVNVYLPDSANSQIYIKGVFFKSGKTNYFGLNKVNGAWVKNSENFASQKQVQLDSSGNWSGKIEVQPDINDSGFEGSGEYVFKIGRYSQSGTGPVWSNESTVNINQTSLPQPTPAKTPTPTPSLTPAPIPITRKNQYQLPSLSSPSAQPTPEVKGAQTLASEPKKPQSKYGKNLDYWIAAIPLVAILGATGAVTYFAKRKETL